MLKNFPEKKYNIIYADPAWHFSNWSGKGTVKAPINHYQTMKLQDICNLPVKEITDKDCILFIWTCDPLLHKVFQVIDSWGFTYKTMGFVWVKTTKENKPKMGLGYWTRGSTEYCILATKGKPKRICKSVSKTIIERPREHSRKPDCVRDRIVELCGDLPRIELFARQKVDGWDCWGNEINE
mgnify:FL=1